MVESLPCPSCGQPVVPGGEAFPFCRQRCKQVDLYKWLTGDMSLEDVDSELDVDATSGEDAPAERRRLNPDDLFR